MIFLLVVVPYSVYPFYYFCVAMKTYKLDAEWWDSIKGNRSNVVLKFRSNGHVHLDKWGQIGMGFVTFLLFGTGTDAHNTYKKMLLAVGLGKIFPSLYVMRESGPSTFLAARTWTSSCVSKAKSYFSKGSSSLSTFGSSTFSKSTRGDSVALDNMDSIHLHSVSSSTPVLRERTETTTRPTLLRRIFARVERHGPVLPIFSQTSTPTETAGDQAVVETATEGFSARAWASETPMSRRNSEPTGVFVFREVHLDEEVRNSTERKSADDWFLRP